jgi:hypothetical protein
MTKKVIAFSLWGTDSRYLDGALQNASLARLFYPGWTCRYYIGQSTFEKLNFINKLKSYNNVEIIKMEEDEDWTGMFWRFYTASDPSVDIMISRDADSRLGFREATAVNEWVRSEKCFHIMRDHPQHAVSILGGMWGVKRGLLPDMKQAIKKYKPESFWQTDQLFLDKVIYPRVRAHSLVHDEFFEKKPFPEASKKRNVNHFVGQAYSGDGAVLDVSRYGIQSYIDYLNKQGYTWEA